MLFRSDHIQCESPRTSRAAGTVFLLYNFFGGSINIGSQGRGSSSQILSLSSTGAYLYYTRKKIIPTIFSSVFLHESQTLVCLVSTGSKDLAHFAMIVFLLLVFNANVSCFL